MTSPSDHFQPAEPAPRSSALSLREAAMLQTGLLRSAANEEADDSVDIKALFRIVYKHKWLLIAVTLLCVTAAIVKTLTSTPLYQAATTLQIERPPGRIVSFNRDVDSSQDSDDYLALPTQIEVLRSRAMAERVIDDLGLDPARGASTPPGILGSPTSLKLSALAAVPQSAPAGGPGAPEAASAGGSTAPQARGSDTSRSGPGYLAMLLALKDRTLAGYDQLGRPSVTDQQLLSREAVVGGFMGSVRVDAVPGTRLVRVSVVGADPARAARVANGIAQNFMAMNMERKVESSVYARNFLEDQLKVTKARLEESERTLNAYARANSILSLDDKTSVVNQSYVELSAALAKLEQDRIKAEALYAEMARNPQSSSQVLDNKTVQAFKEQKAKLEAEYLVNLGTYKPEFPKMLQTRAQIDEMEVRIKAEVASVLASVKSQFDAAKRQEDQVRVRLQDTRKEVLGSQDRGVDLSLLRRELDTNRQMYDSLLQRLKEVGVTSGVVVNTISVVDSARTPLFPFSPKVMPNVGYGLAVGLILGLGFIFLREHLDDSVKHSDEVEAQFGVPLLGIIPTVKKQKLVSAGVAQMVVDDPRGVFAEAYRSMRTALQFSTSEGAPKRLMVTSSVAKEGKSTTALALAVNFAQLGRRVLLVDADMRNPSLHRSLEMGNERGLSNYLSGEGTRESLIRETSVPNLMILTAGPMPPSPVDLLMGPKLLRLLDKAEDMGFDQVVIDAPPILGIADALVLGNQVQSVLFVMRAGATRRSSIKDALRRLRTAGLLPLGVALTRTSSQHGAYYGYEGYYGYGYGPNAEKRGKEPEAAWLDRARA